MKKIISIASIILAFSLSAETKYQITPYAGYNFTDSDAELKDYPLVGVSFDTFLNERYGLRLGFENGLKAKYKGYPSSTGMENTDIYRYYVNAIVNANDTFQTYFAFDPYLFGGIGYEDVDKNCLGEKSQGFTNVGVGIRFPINEELSIVSEAKAIQKWKNKDVDVVGNIGVGYRFGECAPTPAAAPLPPPKVEPKPEPKTEKIVIYNQFPAVTPVVQPTVKPAVTNECVYANTIPKSKDICDNRNYIQVAAKLKCLPNEEYDNKKFLNKIKRYGYHYIIYNTTNRAGKKVSKVLIGPYRCLSDAKRHLCDIKRKIAKDAFVYRK
ncbi:MAG: porin family protein [Epsilonproteobacteria bacterium]|nr:porin family protein [Campylobacterota bacterium]